MNAPLLVLMSSCFVALAMAGVLFVIARSYPRSVRGLREWSRGASALALALPLLAARGHIPYLFSIVLANLLILAAFMLLNAGMRRFSGVEARIGRPRLLAFVLVYTGLFTWFTYVQPSITMRMAITGVFTLVVIADQLRLALQRLPPTAGRHLLVGSLSFMAAARVVRLTTLAIDQPTSLFDPSITHFVYVAIPSILIPFVTISLVMLASERLHQDLEFTSRYDDLTQCLNKRAATEELQREIARARRHGSPLAVMLIDLDNFKEINDTLGHLEGDKVLVDFAKQARAMLRETDALSRFGGDEFMAFLPDTGLDQAARVAERIHEAGRAGQTVAWSVSIGVTEWQDEGDSLAALLTRADNALYKSKASGRNQTQFI
jgi:diguanylate cyclase (GGDEF)-like protein